MALNRWQRLYRKVQRNRIGRQIMAGIGWLYFLIRTREVPPRGAVYLDPFPGLYGMDEQEEVWARDVIGRYEERREQR